MFRVRYTTARFGKPTIRIAADIRTLPVVRSRNCYPTKVCCMALVDMQVCTAIGVNPFSSRGNAFCAFLNADRTARAFRGSAEEGLHLIGAMNAWAIFQTHASN